MKDNILEKWNAKIAELKLFFYSAKVPKNVQLTEHENITDTTLFIRNHFNFIERNIGKKIAIPYTQRLIKLKEIVEKL